MARKEHKASAAGGRCPICKAPTDTAYRPFCSARCRDVDLARWLRGAYAIPGGQAAADEDGEAAGRGDRPARAAMSREAAMSALCGGRLPRGASAALDRRGGPLYNGRALAGRGPTQQAKPR